MRRPRRTRSLSPPGQLSLPLELPVSAHAAPSRNPVLSIATRQRRRPIPVGPNPASLGPLDSVPVSCDGDSATDKKRQRQRFLLTSMLSTLITEANGKRWCSSATLPSLQTSKEPELSSGCSLVGRGSFRHLSPSALVGHSRRSGLSSLRLRCRLHLQGP